MMQNFDISNIPIFTYVPKKIDFLNFINEKYEESNHKIDNFHFYIDLKGCLRNIYLEEVIAQIYNLSSKNEANFFILRSIFQFIQNINIWMKEVPHIKYSFIFFMENHSSVIHDIESDGLYKLNRNNFTFRMIDSSIYDEFTKVRDLNFKIWNTMSNFIPRVKNIALERLEADFIPYFIIKYYNFPEKENTANLIFSSDKDLHQCLYLPNTYQFIKKSSRSKTGTDLFLNDDNYMSSYFKDVKNIDEHISSDLFPFILSIQGDSSDNVIGFKGCGKKYAYQTLLKLFSNSNYKDLNMKTIINDLFFNKDKNNSFSFINDLCNLIKSRETLTMNDKVKRIKSNLKLTSFEYLSQLLLNKNNLLTESYDTYQKHLITDISDESLNIVQKNLQNSEMLKYNELISLLTKSGYNLDTNELQYLYI